MPQKYRVNWDDAYADFKRSQCSIREFREKHIHRFCSDTKIPSLTWITKRFRMMDLANITDETENGLRPGPRVNQQSERKPVQVFKLTPEILRSRKSSEFHQTETNGSAVDVLLPNGVKFRFSSGNPESFARTLIASFADGGLYAD